MSGSVYVSSCLIVAIRVGKRRILSRKGNVEEGFAPVRTQAEVTKVTPSFLALAKQTDPPDCDLGRHNTTGRMDSNSL